MEQISKEAKELIACVTGLLDNIKIEYQLKEIDLSYPESIWYQVTIKTRPESGLTVFFYLFRDAIGLFCNEYEIFIYLSKKPSEFASWIEYIPKLITAIFRPELRIRGRKSLLSGKKAAIWLEFPEGGKWMGDQKACKGSGKEFNFKNWF